MGREFCCSLRLPRASSAFSLNRFNNCTFIPRCISITFRPLIPPLLGNPFERLCTSGEDEAPFLYEQSSGIHEQEFLHLGLFRIDHILVTTSPLILTKCLVKTMRNPSLAPHQAMPLTTQMHR